MKNENLAESGASNVISETGLGFSQRDKNIKSEEEQGLLEFKVIRNDGQELSMKLLTDLKNIIAKQLPKMPKEYIVRLVFDRKHESMVIMKNANKIVGGVCYRPNRDQGFIEIAFLAISSLEQVKGYGTRLMNKLKDHCKVSGLQYFLTYADNNAIGYFKKQGFTNYVKMPVDKWKDYIKDYDGGTLMEAYCNPMVDYSSISEIIKKQKDSLRGALDKLLNVKVRRSYDDLQKNLKSLKKTREENDENDGSYLTEQMFLRIPGMSEAKWEFKDYENFVKNDVSNENFYTQCKKLLDKIRSNKNSWPFQKPVETSDAADYYEVIKEPMDIQTIQTNLDSGMYKSKESFVRDLRKIFSNARSYNKPCTIYHKYAKDIENSIEDDIKNLKDH